MLENIAKRAKTASYILASLNTETKNNALKAMAEAIEKNKEKIFEENKRDLLEAEKQVKEGSLSKALYDRLKLDKNKLADMISGIHDVAKLEDPVNKKLWGMKLDENLDLYRISCPLGVIGVIFEARPEVVVQIAALAVKSANAVILKGGSEADRSNTILAQTIEDALSSIEEFPKGAINLIKTREDVKDMLQMEEYIDLIIPRGSNSLVKYIQSNTKIPVLGHAEGICHIYVDESADFEKAVKIIVDSKTQYPSACNAVETVLVNNKIAGSFLPLLIEALKKEEVEIKGDEKTKEICPDVILGTEEDWKTEYSDKILSIKVVENIMEAIDHINTYGSGHTDCIITENKEKAELFMNLVDSAGVFHNASTRFSDGFRYGLGAEVGISTNKTHARGPVGLEGLVIYKYKLYGNGNIVADYSGVSGKKFIHKNI